MDKGYIRKQIQEYSKILNMKEVCRQANVDPSNLVMFRVGHDNRMSEEKLKRIVSVINAINIEEEVPVTGTNEGEENES